MRISLLRNVFLNEKLIFQKYNWGSYESRPEKFARTKQEKPRPSFNQNETKWINERLRKSFWGVLALPIASLKGTKIVMLRVPKTTQRNSLCDALKKQLRLQNTAASPGEDGPLPNSGLQILPNPPWIISVPYPQHSRALFSLCGFYFPHCTWPKQQNPVLLEAPCSAVPFAEHPLCQTKQHTAALLCSPPNTAGTARRVRSMWSSTMCPHPGHAFTFCFHPQISCLVLSPYIWMALAMWSSLISFISRKDLFQPEVLRSGAGSSQVSLCCSPDGSRSSAAFLLICRGFGDTYNSLPKQSDFFSCSARSRPTYLPQHSEELFTT